MPPQIPIGIAPPSGQHNVHPTYRPDIDGLRAVAILSVVMYHAFPTRLSGGFVGVDIFFVISGFLISSIIFRSLQRGDFSFTEFFAHRIKRIFPALILVLISCFIFGWFALLPDEYKQLGKHIAAGSGFVQNIILWDESGYFDTVSELKPLLHLWSLAIEEQFYLLYPLLIWGVWRMGFNVLTIIALLGSASFILNIQGVEKETIKTFFLPQTRFWELLAGAVLAYVQLFKRVQFADTVKRILFHPSLFLHPPLTARRDAFLNNLQSSIGLGLIAAAVFGLSNASLFPGWWALLPVIGATLLILSGPDAWINRHILSNKFMVFIGLISYPLYLWHWPLLSFAHIINSGLPSREIRIGIILLSVFLAWITYRFIETPFRLRQTTWVKTALLSAVMLIIGAVGYITYSKEGLTSRHTIVLFEQYHHDLLWDNSNLTPTSRNCSAELASSIPKLGYCKYSNGDNPTYALIGDSHADHLFPGISKADSHSWLLIGNHSCPPVSGLKISGIVDNCNLIMDKAIQQVAHSPTIQTVVLSFFGNYAADKPYAADHLGLNTTNFNFELLCNKDCPTDKWDQFFIGLNNTVALLENSNKAVVIVIDIPELALSPKTCIERPFSFNTNNVCSEQKINVLERQKLLRNVITRLKYLHPKLRVFDSLSVLCDDASCYAIKSESLLYRDSHHLSTSGSDAFAKSFLNWLYLKNSS